MSDEYVPKFGKLVKRGAAQESAVPRKPFFVRQQLAVFLFICHRAELYQSEYPSVPAGALLHEKGIPPHFYRAHKRQNKQQR